MLLQRRIDRTRWESTPPAVRDAVLQLAHDDMETRHAETAPGAIHEVLRWLPEEDAYLIRHWHAPAYEVAHVLGRSLYAVNWRRYRFSTHSLLGTTTALHVEGRFR